MLVTDEFRRDLRKWLERPGHNQSMLARAIGCDPSNISQLLNKPDDYRTSVWVQPIAKFTGIAMPHAPTEVTDTDAELLERLRSLRETDPATYDAIQALLKART
jgi:hypothetical protein